jgi:hypothetical protein
MQKRAYVGMELRLHGRMPMRPGEPAAGVYVTSFGAVAPRRHGAHDDRTKVFASRAHGLQSRCRCGQG